MLLDFGSSHFTVWCEKGLLLPSISIQSSGAIVVVRLYKKTGLLMGGQNSQNDLESKGVDKLHKFPSSSPLSWFLALSSLT